MSSEHLKTSGLKCCVGKESMYMIPLVISTLCSMCAMLSLCAIAAILLAARTETGILVFDEKFEDSDVVDTHRGFT